MEINKDILKWWIDQDPLSSEELKLVSSYAPENNWNSVKSMLDWDLDQQLIDRCPFNNLQGDFTVSISKCATDIINWLFDTFVEEDTLVVSSKDEHESTRANFKKCNNLYLVDTLRMRHSDVSGIIQESKKYKKVFIYIIGTHISSGEVTPNSFFINLKKELFKNKIQHIMVLDDVQGMYLVPRDYSIFDYIVGTAHSLVIHFNAGILIYRKGLPSCGIDRCLNPLDKYLNCLDIVLSRRKKLFQFQSVMAEVCQKWISLEDKFKRSEYSVPNVFSMVTNQSGFTLEHHEIFRKHYIHLDGADVSNYKNITIRFRAQEFLAESSMLLDGLDKLDILLEEILY